MLLLYKMLGKRLKVDDKKKRLKKKLKKLGDLNNETVVDVKQATEEEAEFNEEFSDTDEKVVDTQDSQEKSNRQLQLLSEELGLDEYKEQLKSKQKADAVNTSGKEPEIIVFKSHKRKIRDKKVKQLYY